MTVIGQATLELRGDATHFQRTMASALAQFRSLGAQTQQVDRGLAQSAANLKAVAGNLRSVGVGLTAAVTLPLAAIGAGASKAAIAFESSFAGIRKTMDLTESEFAELAAANRRLAQEIPVTANELNRIGELGGQLGIEGVANVLTFEETIAQLAVTTDLTADQAALSFAQIANVMQLPQSELDRLGAAVVGLGNNFATVESQIVEFATRIAGAGKIAGLTAGDVTGIGTAFASLGVNAEAGGTAVQKVLINMVSAVQQGGSRLDAFARTAGMSADQFAAAFEDDAAGAFVAFVEGLGVQGNAAIGTLEELGLQDQRLTRAFLAAAGAGDLLSRAVAQGNAEFEANTALTEEANKRFETMQSRLRVLKNRVVDIGISLGNALLPVVGDLVDLSEPVVRGIASMARAFAELPQFARQVTVALAALAAAAGPLLIAMGGVISMIANLTLIANTALGAAALGGLGTLLATAGPIVAGAIAAAGAIGFLTFKLTESAREAKKAREELDEFRESLGRPVTIDLVRDFEVEASLAAVRVAALKDEIDDALSVGDVRLAEELRGKLNEAEAELERFRFRAQQIGKLDVETEATVRADISDAEEKLNSLLTRIRQIEDEEITFQPVLSPRGFVIESASDVRQSELDRLNAAATDTSNRLNELDADLATFTTGAADAAGAAASAGTQTVEGLKEALTEIRAELRRVDVRGVAFGLSDLEIAEERVRVLESSLEELIALDLSPTSAVMQRYATALDEATAAAARLRDPMGDLVGQFERIEQIDFTLPDFSAIGGRAFAGRTIAALPDLEQVQRIGAPNLDRGRQEDIASLTPSQRQDFIDGVPLDQLTGKIKTFGEQTKELLFGVGQDMITGLIQGTLSFGDILKRFLLGFASRFILGPLAGALGIASPSDVTRGYGQDLGAGLVAGMRRMRPAVRDAALSLASVAAVSLPPVMLPSVAVRAPDTAVRAAGSGIDVPSTVADARDRDRPMNIYLPDPWADPNAFARSPAGQRYFRVADDVASKSGHRRG